MRYVPFLALLFVFLVALVPGAAGGQSTASATYGTPSPSSVSPPLAEQAPVPDISAGIPPVSTEQFVSRLSGLAGRLYNIVGMLAPYLLLVLLALAVFGFIFRELWRMLIFAVLGYVILQFAPMIIGLMEHYFAR